MQTAEVVVIDYGVGNLLSVRRGLERCGAQVTITDDHHAILAAPRVVLPGVGAFADAMAELRSRNLIDVLKELPARGTPLLGICLGMQMLLDESEEFGMSSGLGLIQGRVTPIDRTTLTGEPHKIPHIGWNGLIYGEMTEDWHGTILQQLTPGNEVYFVHSYSAHPVDPQTRLADCIYNGRVISAVIRSGKVYGCQFHPEKSGEVGLRVLKSFLDI